MVHRQRLCPAGQQRTDCILIGRRTGGACPSGALSRPADGAKNGALLLLTGNVIRIQKHALPGRLKHVRHRLCFQAVAAAAFLSKALRRSAPARMMSCFQRNQCCPASLCRTRPAASGRNAAGSVCNARRLAGAQRALWLTPTGQDAYQQAIPVLPWKPSPGRHRHTARSAPQ